MAALSNKKLFVNFPIWYVGDGCCVMWTLRSFVVRVHGVRLCNILNGGVITNMPGPLCAAYKEPTLSFRALGIEGLEIEWRDRSSHESRLVNGKQKMIQCRHLKVFLLLRSFGSVVQLGFTIDSLSWLKNPESDRAQIGSYVPHVLPHGMHACTMMIHCISTPGVGWKYCLLCKATFLNPHAR